MHRKADGERSPKFLKSRDMSHRKVITSISDVFIPECIMLNEATQCMLDLKLANSNLVSEEMGGVFLKLPVGFDQSNHRAYVITYHSHLNHNERSAS